VQGRVFRADNDVEVAAQLGEGAKGELDRQAALRGHDPPPPALGIEPLEDAHHPVARTEIGVQRLVVLAVGSDELVDPLLAERPHLVVQSGAADGGQQLFGGNLALQNRLRCMAERGQDDRRGVDQRPVEIEEDRLVAHVA
jgi:hypothetical protein